MAKDNNKTVLTIEEINDTLLVMSKAQLEADKLENSMNDELTEIREKYENDIKEQRTIVDDGEKELLNFVENNKHLFAEKRTLKFTHGELSLKKTSKNIFPLKQSITWDYIKDQAKKLFGDRFTITKTELKKTELKKAAVNKTLTPYEIKTLGIKVAQEANFNFKLYLETIESEDKDAKNNKSTNN